MFARANDLLRNDDGTPYLDSEGKPLDSAFVCVVDVDLDEKLGTCFQADTRTGNLFLFKTDGARIVRESHQLPNGEVRIDLVVLQRAANFDLVHRETGEVLAEYRLPRWSES